MTAAYVYEVYDRDARLIYVGSTGDVVGRMRQHVMDSWWIDQAVRVRAWVYPDTAAARVEERRRIREMHPRWNLAGQAPRWSWTPEQYEDYITCRKNKATPAYGGMSTHYLRVATEFRFRFGRDLTIPERLLPARSA